jgi:hypothetical protein
MAGQGLALPVRSAPFGGNERLERSGCMGIEGVNVRLGGYELNDRICLPTTSTNNLVQLEI